MILNNTKEKENLYFFKKYTMNRNTIMRVTLGKRINIDIIGILHLPNMVI